MINQRMTALDWHDFWKNFDEDCEDIGGLIFRNKQGKWITVFAVDSRDYRCQVDYNPWTGEKLD